MSGLKVIGAAKSNLILVSTGTSSTAQAKSIFLSVSCLVGFQFGCFSRQSAHLLSVSAECLWRKPGLGKDLTIRSHAAAQSSLCVRTSAARVTLVAQIRRIAARLIWVSVLP